MDESWRTFSKNLGPVSYAPSKISNIDRYLLHILHYNLTTGSVFVFNHENPHETCDNLRFLIQEEGRKDFHLVNEENFAMIIKFLEKS